MTEMLKNLNIIIIPPKSEKFFDVMDHMYNV
jgi:hypothetical protein